MKTIHRDCHCRSFSRRADLRRLKLRHSPAVTKGAAPLRHRGKLPVGPPVQPNTLEAPQTCLKTKTRLEKLKAKPDPKAIQEKSETLQQLPILLKAKAWEEAAKLYAVLRSKGIKVPHAQESLILKGRRNGRGWL